MQLPFVSRSRFQRAINEVYASHRSFDTQNDFVADLMKHIWQWTRDVNHNLYSSSDQQLRGRAYAALQDLSRIIGQGYDRH